MLSGKHFCALASRLRFQVSFLRTTAILLLLLGLATTSMAQLRRVHLPRQPSGAVRTENSAGRTQAGTALELPFFDDFSKPFNDLYADTSLWESSYSTWLSDGMAIHPPTLFVATFDGLDSAGRAYNPNEVLASGYTDALTSHAIDLSADKVSIAERPTVYLSFFYQWQGNVEAPDEKDFLELDFKTAEADGWETVMTIFPKENPDATVFYDTILQISGDRFFHNQFRFRFRSYGRQSGPFDSWHVDYVYLNKGRTANDLSFPDRAISTQLGPLFGPYRAMPRNHFLSNAQLTPPAFEIQNMKNVEAAINFRTIGYFSSTDLDTKNTISYETVISKATPINITDNVIFAREHRSVRMDTLPDIHDPQQFPPDPGIDSTLIRLTLALQTRDDIPIEPDSNGDYTPNYRPIRFTVNDTLTADYVLSSYYAYDDGVGEYGAGLIEPGNLVAYQFEIDTTYGLKQDTLVGFDISFPPYAITSNQTVDFYIYHDDGGVPGEQWLRIPSRRVLRKGVNEFQRIEFLPALLIDEPKFYIGWKEPLAGEVVVGLDVSNDTGDRIYVNTTGSWYQNEDVRGSLMLRPVFGSGVVDTRVGVEEAEIASSALYPNPNHGTFYIDGQPEDISIISLTGEPVSFSSQRQPLRTEIRIHSSHPGLYIARYLAGGKLKTEKIIIGP